MRLGRDKKPGDICLNYCISNKYTKSVKEKQKNWFKKPVEFFLRLPVLRLQAPGKHL